MRSSIMEVEGADVIDVDAVAAPSGLGLCSRYLRRPLSHATRLSPAQKGCCNCSKGLIHTKTQFLVLLQIRCSSELDLSAGTHAIA
jgi:hypothetical protein